MDGLGARIYNKYTRLIPIACAVNCPVCDLPYHFTKRDDIPRNIYDVFGSYECEIDGAMLLHSSIHNVIDLPRISYFVVNDDEDTAVNKGTHSDRLVILMKENSHDVT